MKFLMAHWVEIVFLTAMMTALGIGADPLFWIIYLAFVLYVWRDTWFGDSWLRHRHGSWFVRRKDDS